MKKISSILLIIFFSASQIYGQTIYVGALSGLTLREKPDTSGNKLDLIPYGTELIDSTSTRTFVEIDGYLDIWRKVNYRGKREYVFGGYVLLIKPPDEKQGSIIEFLSASFDKPFQTITTETRVGNANSKYYINGIGYSNTDISGAVDSYSIFKSTLPTNVEPKLTTFKSPMHYTAFFCKMELKTVKRIGIWVKIHAGDYDAYMGGCENQRQ